MYEVLAVLALFATLYSAVAGRVEKTWISGPIIFTGFGLLIGVTGLGVIGGEKDFEMLGGLAELTLALVLFTDAAGANLSVLRRFKRLPIRLLGVGLPLTILLGYGLGVLVFPDLGVFEVALLATMLAPTDAALGKGVITNQAVPEKVREGLNVESGFNDGICVPILLLFLALAQQQITPDETLEHASFLLLEEVGIALLVGLTLSVAAVFLFRFCHGREWLSPTWQRITVIAVAFSCFGTAQALGGSGFIASFAGGMLFGGLLRTRHGKLLEELLESAEGVGDTFSLLTWVVFGGMIVGRTFDDFTGPVILYSLLSLTVVRMLPVFLVMTGLRATREDKLFIGWFGPRGLASIVFAVMVLDAKLPHGDVVSATVVCTVLLSILLHGVTANPWAARLGARAQPSDEAAT